jgi:hypothetical protein
VTTESTELLITVSPIPHGWTLLGASAAPVVFRSGAEAERSARRLAATLARAGHSVVVEILLRDGRLGGRLRFGQENRRDAASALELEPA